MANIPTGVKIISVLYYIGAVFSLIGGILAFAGGAFFSSLIPEFLGSLVVFFGIILIAFAVLSFFIARGLWKGQSWARTLAVIFAVLTAINALITLISRNYGSIASLVISGFMAYYLWFNKEVKKAFA